MNRVFLLALLIAVCATTSRAESRVHSFKPCRECPRMVSIAPGKFILGAPEHASRNRQFGWGGPEVTVLIATAFAIGSTEVTRGEWARFVVASGYVTADCVSIWQSLVGKDPAPSWREPRFPGGVQQTDDHPVVCVSWADAMAYISWLNKIAGKRYEFFLPSEAQWEYAARAGESGERSWSGPLESACQFANVGDQRYQSAIRRPNTIDCDDADAIHSKIKLTLMRVPATLSVWEVAHN